MDTTQLVKEEIDIKHNYLLQRLGSGSIKDYSEYRYMCGIISGIVAIKEYIENLEERYNEDE